MQKSGGSLCKLNDKLKTFLFNMHHTFVDVTASVNSSTLTQSPSVKENEPSRRLLTLPIAEIISS